MKIRFHHVAIASALLTILACGGSSGTDLGSTGSTGGSVSESMIEATWKKNNVSYNGQSSACPGSVPLGPSTLSCGDNDTLTFNNDHTYHINGSTTDAGTWFLQSDTLTFTSTAGNGVYQFGVAEPDANTLDFACVYLNKTYVIETKKQ